MSLPYFVVEVLEKYSDVLQLLSERQKSFGREESTASVGVEGKGLHSRVVQLRTQLLSAFERAWRENRGDSQVYWGRLNCGDALKLVDQIWAFGPRKAAANLLINLVPAYQYRSSVWQEEENGNSSRGIEPEDPATEDGDPRYGQLEHSVVAGFQLSCAQGPLCEEPTRGVAYLLVDWRFENDDEDGGEKDMTESSTSAGVGGGGPMTGQVMAALKEGCRLAFERQPQRLVAAMYSCVISVSADALGKLYAVLAKRRGRVLKEEMNEGTNVFQVTAVLPVCESFGFCEDVRKKTSGLASPQLVFSHWETLDVDPYWVPTTEEETTHFGAKADSENQARKYMNAVRKRKGLQVDEKLVTFAEKQRTISRKK